MNWRAKLMSSVARRPDDETGSGAPAPQPDRITALEQRIQQLTGVVETVTQSRVADDAKAHQDRAIATAEASVREAAAKVAAARQKLATAHESGDPMQIADATAEIGTLTATHVAAQMQAQQVRQQVEQQRKAPARPQVDDTNLRAWRDANKTWYGVDPDMTAKALEIGKQIEREQVFAVGSKGYFDAITARVRSQFPDRFRGNDTPGFTPARGNAMPDRDTREVRIPAAVAEGYRKMGIDVDNPETAKQLVAARAKAVEKGFLPDRAPADLRIVTR